MEGQTCKKYENKAGMKTYKDYPTTERWWEEKDK